MSPLWLQFARQPKTRPSQVTHLSAESVFEVEVKKRSWSLGANSRLKIELVSLENIVNILGFPVDNSPENEKSFIKC